MKAYHGSPNQFTEFKFDFIRTNGTSEGIGFYFTDNKQIAANYAQNGFIYTVNIDGKKALSDNEITLTRNELASLVTELDKHNDCLSNYGDTSYEGFQNVLNMALDNLLTSESDTEILADLFNSNGEDNTVIDLFVNLLGYDHAVIENPEWGNQTIITVLTNDIISIENIEEYSH